MLMQVTRVGSSLVVLLLVLLFSSCKKENDNHPDSSTLDYYIKFTLDGIDNLNIYNAEGNINVVDTSGKFTFSGAALKIANTIGSSNISLAVANTSQMTTNICYVNYTNMIASCHRAAVATVSYVDAWGIVFNSWGDEFASTGVISNSKITFTEITPTNLRGTFSGTAYKSRSGTAVKRAITKGEFNLKRK